MESTHERSKSCTINESSKSFDHGFSKHSKSGSRFKRSTIFSEHTSDFESCSTSTDTESVVEDYFLKFNNVSGLQSLVLMQFQGQMYVVILFYLFFWYIGAVFSMAFAFGSPVHMVPTENNEITAIVHTGDIVYFLDWVSMVVFKNMNWPDITIQYQSRHGFILFVELLSLIPLEPIYGTLVKANVRIYYSLRLRYCLRLCRLYVFYKQSREYVGHYSHVVHLCTFFAILVLVIISGSAIYYITVCKGMCAYGDYDVVSTSIYACSITIISGVGVKQLIGIEPSFVDSTVISIFSFFMALLFTSYFVCDTIHSMKPRFVQMNLYERYKAKINEWKADIEWTTFHRRFENLIYEYCTIYWHKTRGESYLEYKGKYMPAIFYQDLALDTTWIPLKHSHLFRNQDVYFIRAVAEVMQHKFLCPGEVLYKKECFKGCMYYIISGTVDVLSEEDGETAVISFTAGTCLGEATLGISYAANITVVSRDTTDVAVLHRRDLMRLASKYPREIRGIFTTIKVRYERAKGYRSLAEYQFATKSFKEQIGVLTLKWLKFTLSNLLYDDLESTLDEEVTRDMDEIVFCVKYLDLLVQSKDIGTTANLTFVRSKFPVIFRPNSLLLKAWFLATLGHIMALALSYPYIMVFEPDISISYNVFLAYINIIWLVDIYVKSSTAVSTKYLECNELSEILMHNMTQVCYYADIFAAIPIEGFIYLLNGQLSENQRVLFAANRLLKIYLLEDFFDSLCTNIKLAVIINYTKFGVYFFLLCYYASMCFYVIGWYDENVQYFTEFLGTFSATTTADYFFYSMFCAVQFARDMALTPFPFVVTYRSVFYLELNIFFDMVLSLFMVACSISLEWIQLMDAHCFNEFMRNVYITMNVFKFDEVLRRRTLDYIDLQYVMTNTLFLFDNDLFHQLPADLYVMTNGVYPGSFLKNLFLFYHLDDKMIGKMAATCNSCFVLRNETIKLFGEDCSEIFILVEGSCKIKHLDSTVVEVGTGTVFFEFEAAFSIKSCISLTTLTPCRFISLSYVKYKMILFTDQREFECMQNTVKYFPYWEEVDKLCETKPVGVVTKHIAKPTREKNIKKFGYRLKKRTEPYYDIHTGFPKFAAPFKVLLMRYTFHNNGQFVTYYEMYRCISIVLYIAILPHSLVLGPDNLYWTIIRYGFDVLAMIDVYMRLHFSYFDPKTNLEIIHPWKTAVYYWKHAFAVDVLGCLPLETILSFVNSYPALWRCNRLLQLYRVSGYLTFFFSKKLEGIWRVLIYLPIIILILNFAAYEVLMLYCTYEDGTHKCLATSFLGAAAWLDMHYTVYLYNLIFVACVLFGGNYYIVEVYTTLSVYVFYVLSFIGMYVHVVITAKVTASNLAVNRDLMAYQEAMQHLQQFWSQAKIDKKLKKEVVKHFDYMWDNSRGKTILSTFSVFRTYFKTDILSQVYGTVFVNSSIFLPPNDNFFRTLLFDAKHEIYLKTGLIYRVNDINTDVFLLLKGKVDVVGPDLNRLVSLEVGSVFGNIDQTPISRMTVSIVASGHVEVLRFSTLALYKHLAKFPPMLKHFKHLTTVDIDYLIENNIVLKTVSDRVHTSKMRIPTQILKLKYKAQLNSGIVFAVIEHNILLKVWDHFLYAAYFFSYVLELYNISCFETHPFCFVLLYFFDILNLVKIYLKFVTSYDDEYGRTIMVRPMIVDRYKKQKLGFYFDLCTVLPIELLSLAFIRQSYFIFVYVACRVNRLPRIVFTIVFFRDVSQKLTAHVVLVRLSYLLLWIFLMQLNIGFILKLLDGRSGDTVYERMELFGNKLQLVVDACRKVGTPITGTQQNNLKYVAYTATLIASQVIYAVFMAESCAIILLISHSQIAYRQFIIFMQRYMKSESVSAPLRHRISSYVKLLWTNNKGIQFPNLLNKAPYYLKEGVLYSMFGILMIKHDVLKHCHKDLTRQICARMKTLVFFPGDNVVYMGDIDDCMYFIYEGEVHALSEDSMYSEVVDEILVEGDMFGLEQGLYPRTGHDYTYKCVKYTTLVYLKRNDWIHLLEFFPASKSMIIDDDRTSL